MCGDLNSHSQSWYCNDFNQNGRTLEDLLINSNFNCINNKKTTHKCPSHGNESIIDLFIISADLNDKTSRFNVISSDRISGHYPVIASFNLPTKRFSGRKTLYIKKLEGVKMMITFF